jgi:hypothetical protein
LVGIETQAFDQVALHGNHPKGVLVVECVEGDLGLEKMTPAQFDQIVNVHGCDPKNVYVRTHMCKCC